MQGANIAAKNIACRRGDRLLFKQLDLMLNAGDALHIAGANGIGKSSLLRIVAGLLPAFDGTVSCEGAIGLVDERPALDTSSTLQSALQFWARVDGCANVETNCEVMGVDGLLDVPVRFLSTGQKKRAAFVRLLNQNAPVWLLDEPLNGLDDNGRDKVIALTQLHCGGGGIAVIASHQQIAWGGLKTLDLTDFTT